MKFSLVIAIFIAFAAVCSTAEAQSRADQCSAYARQAARSSVGTTGPLRGAAGGAIGGAIAGNAGRGAGIGAAVGAGIGTARRAGQRNQVYQWHFNECMRWP